MNCLRGGEAHLDENRTDFSACGVFVGYTVVYSLGNATFRLFLTKSSFLGLVLLLVVRFKLHLPIGDKRGGVKVTNSYSPCIE